jgi:hypothetical protein
LETRPLEIAGESRCFFQKECEMHRFATVACLLALPRPDHAARSHVSKFRRRGTGVSRVSSHVCASQPARVPWSAGAVESWIPLRNRLRWFRSRWHGRARNTGAPPNPKTATESNRPDHRRQRIGAVGVVAAATAPEAWRAHQEIPTQTRIFRMLDPAGSTKGQNRSGGTPKRLKRRLREPG